MADIILPDIETYLAGFAPARDPVLEEMERRAAKEDIPIVGPLVGAVLFQLATLRNARRIFELGSAIGYSTIWLARAAGADAEIHYSDGSEDNARRARGYFERAGVASRIRVHVGDALTALADTPGEFDLLFNDVDKEGYPAVLEAAPARLKRGGLFLTDNTLWKGRVIHPESAADCGVATFNERLKQSRAFACVSILPVRDGVTVCVRV